MELAALLVVALLFALAAGGSCKSSLSSNVSLHKTKEELKQ
jgi:hypothetical protein